MPLGGRAVDVGASAGTSTRCGQRRCAHSRVRCRQAIPHRRKRRSMRRTVMCVLALLLWASAAGAQERERAFFDLYGGVTRVFESDVAGWKFADFTPTVGARFGAWLGDTPLALTFR